MQAGVMVYKGLFGNVMYKTEYMREYKVQEYRTRSM
jgi:hypothetical protein